MTKPNESGPLTDIHGVVAGEASGDAKHTPEPLAWLDICYFDTTAQPVRRLEFTTKVAECLRAQGFRVDSIPLQPAIALNEIVDSLQEITDEYARAMKDAGVSYYPEALAIVRKTRAVIAKARSQ